MPQQPRGPRIRVPAFELAGGDQNLQRVGVDIFMESVRELAPEAIREFADAPWSPDDPSTPGPKRPSPEFLKWADDWGLDGTSAVFGWAIRARTQWKRNPEWKTALKWKTNIFAEIPFTDSLYAGDYPSQFVLDARDPGLPLEAFPEIESKENFLKRAESHWAGRVEVFQAIAAQKGMTIRPVPDAAARHFAWLAKNQVNQRRGDSTSRMSTSTIAKAEKVRPESVTDGIAAAATTLKFATRPHPPGRPPKPEK